MSIKSTLVSIVAVGVIAAAGWAIATGQVDVRFPASTDDARTTNAVVEAPASAPAGPVASTDRAAIEGIVRDYLLSNPDILREMANALQTRDQAEQAKKSQAAVTELKPKIFSSPLQMEIGNPQGDVTLVEFFDYNCGFCRRTLDDINALIAQDKNLKIVFKEFPVLGEESVQAARVSISVHRRAPEKYAEFHNKLLAAEGQVNGEAALKIAEGLGLNPQELIADANTVETEAYIRESHELAQALGINGTPSFVVGEDMLPGAVGLDALKKAVENVRSCGRAACS